MMFVYQFIKALVLPPGLFLVLLALGLKWRWRWPVWMTLVLLSLLSTPFVAGTLALGLETNPALDETRLAQSQAQAILVLGGGRQTQAPEYGADTPGTASMERLRYAARLARQTGLPVMVSGGSPYKEEEISEAELGRRVLEEDFGLKNVLVEGESPDTRTNIRLSAERLKGLGYTRVLLVTHAWHLPRALDECARVGLDAVPAPMGFISTNLALRPAWRQWLPSAKALWESRLLLHEYLGRLWYTLYK